MELRLLSSLQPSETGSVVRVEGPDDVRRRLVEMGLVPGAQIEVVDTAPLGDPIAVLVRGYRLAIRRSEAIGVTVMPGQPVPNDSTGADQLAQTRAVDTRLPAGPGADRPARRRRRQRRRPQHCHPQAAPFEPRVLRTKTVVVALAGNPNTGKSSVFNALTGGRQHVGNWPGKTVACAEGSLQVDGVTIRFVDLPGAYSLRAASPEEQAAHEFLTSGGPDLVVAVVDSSNLERNLFLVLELAGTACRRLTFSPGWEADRRASPLPRRAPATHPPPQSRSCCSGWHPTSAMSCATRSPPSSPSAPAFRWPSALPSTPPWSPRSCSLTPRSAPSSNCGPSRPSPPLTAPPPSRSGSGATARS
ncbi:MAG: FeoB small GTPase domain-containing protein [Pseudonocardiaceae bacterium]